MTKIKWTEDFGIQNEEIDEQHKKWISIYNEAHDKMIGIVPVDKRDDIGKDALKKMIEYGKYHFSSEEKIMKEIGYSELETHKSIHRDFAKKLDNINLQMQQGIYILNSEIIKTIENWLIDHILTEDKKIFK